MKNYDDILKRLVIGMGAGFFLSVMYAQPVHAQSPRPNVVMIVCDDLNDYVTGMAGHPQARTPNITKLAQSGVAFKRAYSNNPVCAPSRSSFFTGIYPHTSKNLFWDKWHENPVLKNSRTIMEHCSQNLPRYMTPRWVECLDELPRTANRKVDYPALRAKG